MFLMTSLPCACLLLAWYKCANCICILSCTQWEDFRKGPERVCQSANSIHWLQQNASVQAALEAAIVSVLYVREVIRTYRRLARSLHVANGHLYHCTVPCGSPLAEKGMTAKRHATGRCCECEQLLVTGGRCTQRWDCMSLSLVDTDASFLAMLKFALMPLHKGVCLCQQWSADGASQIVIGDWQTNSVLQRPRAGKLPLLPHTELLAVYRS